jgi:hypothetical protein
VPDVVDAITVFTIKIILAPAINGGILENVTNPGVDGGIGCVTLDGGTVGIDERNVVPTGNVSVTDGIDSDNDVRFVTVMVLVLVIVIAFGKVEIEFSRVVFEMLIPGKIATGVALTETTLAFDPNALALFIIVGTVVDNGAVIVIKNVADAPGGKVPFAAIAINGVKFKVNTCVAGWVKFVIVPVTAVSVKETFNAVTDCEVFVTVNV